MLPLRYEGDLYRPPSEAKSLIIQATIGCSHNRCTFCGMYKQKKFRERSLDELDLEIKAIAGQLPDTRRIFLADGNALTIKTEKLKQLLDLLNQAFPRLERISLYGNTQDLLEKSISELCTLRELKLKMIYLGIESGSATVLKTIRKGVTPDQIATGAAKASEAKIPLSVTVLNGLAGLEGTTTHARETASLLNRIDPEYLGLLSLMIIPGTETAHAFRNGLLTELNPWQLLDEIKAMIQDLRLTECIFRANHASNYLPLKAILSQDQEKLLAAIDQILETKDRGLLKNEYMRGL